MTLRKKLAIAGSAIAALAVATPAYLFLPGYFLTRAVEHSFQQQELLLEGATPLFDTVVAKKLVVGDSRDHVEKILADAGQEYTVETDTSPHRLTCICRVGRGAGFSIQLDLDENERVSKVGITKFLDGP